MAEPSLKLVRPNDIHSVGGFLGRRFDANRAGRVKDPILSEEFIRLHERKDHDDWFWLGEQVGKWLDAAAYTALIARDEWLLGRTREILTRLAASQEPDGYLGITRRIHRNPVRGPERRAWESDPLFPGQRYSQARMTRGHRHFSAYP